MEEFARPICDHAKIIIGKKTSERRKVQATTIILFWLLKCCEQKDKGKIKLKKKNRKEKSFMHMLFSMKQLRINPETSPQGCALRKIEGSPVLWNCKI